MVQSAKIQSITFISGKAHMRYKKYRVLPTDSELRISRKIRIILLSGYIRILKYPFNYLPMWLLILFRDLRYIGHTLSTPPHCELMIFLLQSHFSEIIKPETKPGTLVSG